MMETSRRRFIAGSVGAVALTAGCSGDDSIPDEADIVAGPDGRFIFDPEEHTVSVGETVRWYFDSAGHNVSCRPADSNEVSLPEDGQSFATYAPGDPVSSTVARGETFAHTFETAGTFVYVCIPHQTSRMIGSVTVE